MNEHEYDLINNEGGEGYNPYRAERKKREWEERQAWGKTREGRKDRIYRLLGAKDCSIARECGTYNQAEIDELRAQLRGIEAEEQAEFLALWPLEITKARRVAWNARVNALEFGKKVDFRKVHRAETEQGWTMSDLKKAVQLHNL
jgi:uncharacterized protein with von Willebrand factor type A (vWA) domain